MKKTLGVGALTALVAGNMIGSGVFLLPASLAQFGSISVVSWVITALATLVLAFSFSRLSQLVTKTGGPYAYAREAFGDFVGFQVSFCYWIGLWVGNAAIAVACVGYLEVFFPVLSHAHNALYLSIALVWGVTLVNVLGVRHASWLQTLTTVLKLIPLVGLVAIGLFYIHPDFLLKHVNVSHHSNWHAISGAATLTLWAFIGFESATVPAAHVKDPKKTIPRATILGTVIASLVYIGGTIAVMGLVPMKSLAVSHFPFALAAAQLFGEWGQDVIGVAAVIACLGTLNGWVLLQGQIPQSAACDGLFPKQFAKLNRGGSPAFALIVSALLITALLVMKYGANLVDTFTYVILLATVMTLFAYLYASLAEIILLAKNKSKDRPVRRYQSCKVILSAVIGFSYIMWAFWGSGMAVLSDCCLLMMASIPIYVWLKVS